MDDNTEKSSFFDNELMNPTSNSSSSDESEVEDEEPCPSVINFRHTVASDEYERNLMLSRDKPCLNSPGDVYKVFYKPKSILKTHKNSESVTKSNQVKEDYSIKENEQKFEGKESSFKYEPEKVNNFKIKYFEKTIIMFF